LKIQHNFKHFDRNSKGFINHNDFVAAFIADLRHDVQNSNKKRKVKVFEVKDQTFQIHIEDIVKPLYTKIKTSP
jgi:hypothetical protein